MKSIRDLYKIGKGPSSSHTMGPARAAEIFKSENPDAERYEVVLYGSLAKTGVGHGTDRVLRDVFAPKDVQIVFAEHDPDDLKHPNTLDLSAFTGAERTASIRVESIGGGDIVVEGRPGLEPPEVYPENSFAEIAQFCAWRQVSLPQYVEMNEGPEIWDFLKDIWNAMRKEIHDGLSAEGVLPGGLNVQRKAKYLFERGHQVDIPQVRELQQVCAYAFAAAEQNAGNGTIVTAPTCGSCGVLPAVLLYLQDKYKFTDEKIAEGLSQKAQPLRHRRGVRLSGGDRLRLLHGRSGHEPAHGAEHSGDRILRRDRHGAPSRTHLRPDLRPCADPLHRAQRRRRQARHRRLESRPYAGRHAHHLL